MYQPSVSIMIPMFNSEEYIDLCLTSIFSLEYPQDKIQVIVADNASTDHSLEIVKKYAVEVVLCPDGNISRVRNVGAAAAKGEIFAFVDSDCAVGKEWLRSAIEIIGREGVVAAGSGYRLPKDPAWIEKVWLIESQIAERPVKFIPAGNFIVRAEAFRSVNGFNEELITCEDADICERLAIQGNNIINSNRIVSIHLRNPKSVTEFFKKETWYGLNMSTSLQNQIFDKVFILTVLFLTGNMVFACSVLFGRPSYWALFIIILILNLSAFHRMYYSRKFKTYFQLIFLYYVYFLARGFGIIKNIINNRRPLKTISKKL